MIITCEECSTSFILKDEIVKPAGSRVRCSKCQKVFKVFPPAFDEAEPPVFPPGFEAFSDGEKPDQVIQDAPVSEPLKDESHLPKISDDILDYTEYLKSDAFPLTIEPQEPELLSSQDEFLNTDIAESAKAKSNTAFDDIEILDISDMESFIQKQESKRSQYSFEAHSNEPTIYDQSISTVSSSKSETDQPVPDHDRFLSFDELHLDKDESEPARIEKIKESFLKSTDEIESVDSDRGIQTEKNIPEPSFDYNSEPFSSDLDANEDLSRETESEGKKISKKMLIALLAALIVGAGYGGYALLNSMGILSKQETTSKQDPGNLKIKPFDVNSKFIDNVNAGKLFIITGKVKNEYPSTRGYIKVSGKLYIKGNAMAKAETVFCGNMLSDSDLAESELPVILKKLLNPTGDNNMNSKVMPGDAIPFMIVFSNLPDNLEEFTLEVVSSSAS